MKLSVVAVTFTVMKLLLLVQCEKPRTVKVGAVFGFDSLIGRGAKIAMEMAVEDINSDSRILNGSKFEVVMEDSSQSVFTGSIKAFQVIEKEVVAIVGPQSSSIARIVSHIANGLQIPMISCAATDPTLSTLQFPYFFRQSPSDSTQMAAIANVITFYGWKEIIAVFEDTYYGRNGIAALGDELAKKMFKISYKLPLSPQFSLTEVSDTLNKSKIYGPRVYVVHISPDPSLSFFRTAKKLGMMSANYVWFASDWLSTTLDSFDSDGDYLNALQGVVMFHPHIRDTPKKYSRLTAYDLYAYDAMWAVAYSVDRFLKEGKKLVFSSAHLGNFTGFDGGESLVKLISTSNFSGLTGRIQFDDDHNLMGVEYEVINIVENGTYKVGYWANKTGLMSSSLQKQRLDRITWPGGMVERPRGWELATKERPYRIGFPKRVSFNEFISEQKHNQSAQGYCIDVFNEVLKRLPYDVPYRLVPFGDGLKNPSYDELVKMVANDVFDAAVGDIAIVTNRISIVDFTQPFAATGLEIVVPISNSTSSGWVFIRPFSVELWCVTAASFVIIAVVIWILEHRVNDDFRGPPRRQLRTMFLFSFSTLFKTNQESTESPLGKIVMVVWLFLLLVITSSYTASLSSILTVQQFPTGITGLESLVMSGLPIGYQVGSFAYSYMKDNLNVRPSRLVPLGSPQEYESALRRGPENGGVAAIVDETPYVELFLSRRKGYGTVGQAFMKRGWGFVFQKNSPLAIDISSRILKLTESGELQKIHEKWFCKSRRCPGEGTRRSEPNELHLNSFLSLYSTCGIFALVALSIFLVRAIRQYVIYLRRRTDPSPSTFAISSSMLWSEAIQHFFKFIDEKEEAIKRFFEQPSSQVNI